ncbi:MAG: peptidase MA family metallohydrolase [Candidatus Desantisbacteria bacterium]
MNRPHIQTIEDKMWLKILLTIIIMMIPINATANWQVIKDLHFVVTFTENDQKIAETTLRIAHNFHSQVSLHLGGYTMNTPVYIIIAPSREVFENLGGVKEEWAVGLATGNNRIVIFSPRKFGGKSEIERLIRHEYTHILLHQATGGHFVPRWLNEGLAMYYESIVWRIPDDIRLTEAVLTHSIIPLDLLNWYFPSDRKRAELAYSQSSDVVGYIIKEYGHDRLKQLIGEIARGQDIDTAMINSLGIDSSSLETAWHTTLSKRYQWFYIITNTTIIWAALPIICIIAYIRKKRQGERKKRQWEIEDGMLLSEKGRCETCPYENG